MSTNWGGNIVFSARAVRRPRTVDELQSTIARSTSVRVLGSRHSFNAVADTDGEHLDLSGLPATLEVDTSARSARVSGALRYADVVRALDAAGLALPNLGSLPHITVAGACATGTHGSGDGNQVLAAAVSHLELVTASGEVVDLDRTDAVFRGAVIALGSLGAVVTLTLDLVDAFEMRQLVYDRVPLPEVIRRLEEVLSAAYSVSVFTAWTDDSADLWVKSREPWDADAEWFDTRPSAVPLHPVRGEPASNTTAQLGTVGRWHDRLPHFRAEAAPSVGREIQSEYFVARSDAPAALTALRAAAPGFVDALLVSEIRSVAADDLWLSCAYGRDSVGVHFTWRLDLDAVARAVKVVETALAPFGPRPHWGKQFGVPLDSLEGVHPRLANFLDLVDDYDPRGRFANDFTRALRRR